MSGLLSRAALSPSHVDQLILGNVVVSTSSPNIARETVLALNLPRTIPGTTVSIACLSGLEAIALAAKEVERGDVQCVIAGGVDSCSNTEMPLPAHVTAALSMYQMGGGNKKGWAGYRELLWSLGSPWSWLPSAPTVSERSTGKTMGYHADLMAEINRVSREEQDSFSLDSHRKASQARKEGKFTAEIAAVKLSDGSVVKDDNIIRDKIDLGKLASLPPAFRPAPLGSITAATSSPLTDGASAVLVMSEAKAASLQYPTDISIVSYVKSGIDPHPQLLLAPARCIPVALRQVGLTLADIDLLEFHEAFAGQVLSTFRVLAADGVGEVDMRRVNVNGGSVALGHPFAATGGRIVMGVCDEMRRRKARYALISICAAGGIGGVMILERRDDTSHT